MWLRLLDWKHKLPVGEWVVGGDFNVIKTPKERKGKSASNMTEMEEVSKFIELTELIDLPINILGLIQMPKLGVKLIGFYSMKKS